MALDGLTLGSLCNELNCALRDARIDKINQPESDELILQCRIKGENYKLLLCANPSFARLGITNVSKQNPSQPPMFCMLLRKHLTGARIISFNQVENERIVNILIETLNDFNEFEQKTLIIEIMGKHSNIILTDSSGKIIDSVKHVNSLMSRVRAVLPGLRYTLPPSQGKLNPFKEYKEISASARIISETYMGISLTSAQELAFLAQNNSLKDALNDFLYRFASPAPVVLYDENGNAIDFFAFAQQRFSPVFQKPFPTISAAMDECFFNKDKAQRIKERYHGLKTQLTNILDRSLRNKALQEEKLRECADKEKFQIFGELLTANIYLCKKGASEVTVNNYYNNMAPLTIPLDKSISAAANAQKYFKKYAKLKTASHLLQGQMQKTDFDINYISEQLENLEKCEDENDIAQIRLELAQLGYIKPQKGKQKAIESKPMHFVSSSGTDIFVGKNNTQNDKLTMKFASSDDLWLHVKDNSGSHVIIKSADPDKQTVDEAVMLAAYYSKARASSNVAVDATKRKYIKKPGGSAPGKVVYTNQTTYYVTVSDSDIRSIKRKSGN